MVMNFGVLCRSETSDHFCLATEARLFVVTWLRRRGKYDVLNYSLLE
jgi:hypothetical protein